jgi:hypothetical protein
MAKKKRRGETPDPAVRRLAEKAAGVLAEIFEDETGKPIDKNALLHRPRPSGLLRQVRDLMVGVMHFHFAFNAKTGDIARRTSSTPPKHVISQQRIAAALGRDRGVISDAARDVEHAINGDIGVGLAMNEITEQVANLISHADAWRKALRAETLAAAIEQAKDDLAGEGDEARDIDRDIAASVTPLRPMRCHNCSGKGKVRVHRMGGDPKYREAWDAVEKRFPSPNGFHELACRFCAGAGQRDALRPAAVSASAILSASD